MVAVRPATGSIKSQIPTKWFLRYYTLPTPSVKSDLIRRHCSSVSIILNLIYARITYRISCKVLLQPSSTLRSCCLTMTTPTMSLSPEQLQKLLDGPAGTPPGGVIPNFDDPPNLDTYLILTISACMTFATVAVLLRMYTKIFILRSLANEDCKWLCSKSVTILRPLDVIVLAWVSIRPCTKVGCN